METLQPQPQEQSTKFTTIVKAYRYLRKKFPCDRVLAQRVFKSTVNSTVAFIFILLIKVRGVLGIDPSMLALISVIVHPGRRVSGTIHGISYCITGLIFGLAWAIFGRFLAQECLGSYWKTMTEDEMYHNHFIRYQSALGILAMFHTIMLFIHGWLRSVNASYFGIAFPFFIVVHFVFMAPLTYTNGVISDSYATPFYLGIALSLFLNLVLFPEFGSSYLGNSIVDTLNHFHKVIDHSVNFFISMENVNDSRASLLYSKLPHSLGQLCNMRATISKKVTNCGLVFHESLYEISYSYVAPERLEVVIDNIKPLLVYVNGLVDACELKFTLLNKNKNNKMNMKDSHTTDESVSMDQPSMNFDLKINQEIQYADAEKLFAILNKVRPSIFKIHIMLSECIYNAKLALAYSYDVNLKKVNSCSMFKDGNFKKYEKKKQVREEINLQDDITRLENVLLKYSNIFREELAELNLDFLKPDDEMFLFSSFLMNFKQTTKSIITILKTINELTGYRKRQDAKGWLRGKRVWFNFMRSFKTFKTWVFRSYSKGTIVTEGEAFKGIIGDNYYSNGNIANRIPLEEEKIVNNIQNDASLSGLSGLAKLSQYGSATSLNNPTALSIEEDSKYKYKNVQYQKEIKTFNKVIISIRDFCIRSKYHFRFGFQVIIAMMLCTFPMFTPKYRTWYRNYRGPWMGFVCILSMEPSVGDTLWVFFLRGVGVLTGSVWAYVSYVTAGGHQRDPYLETVMTCFGSVPGFYFMLGTPYVKAAIIHNISMYVVMLAAILQSTVPGGILRNFAKRCLAIGYGGAIGLLIQYIIFPMRARDQLNSEVSYVCGCIAKMNITYATALEGQAGQRHLSNPRFQKYLKISQSAKSALARASTYNDLAKREFRIKGDSSIHKIFTRIIFILGHIIDRMDNIALLRINIGSTILSEFNDLVHPYRREVAASTSCIMGMLQDAFINKTPIPQNLPSTRIKHRRLVNSVLTILGNRYRTEIDVIRRNSERRVNQLSTVNETDSLEIRTEEDSTSLNESICGSPHEFYLKEKFLSWNATSSATEEIIAYIEELTYLAKVLVGVNQFKYGFLSRPLYEDWAANAVTDFENFIDIINSRNDSPPVNDSSPVADEMREELSFQSQHDSEEGTVSIETLENLGTDPEAYSGNSNSGIESGINTPRKVNLRRISTTQLEHEEINIQSSYRSRAFSIGTYETPDRSKPMTRSDNSEELDNMSLNDDNSDTIDDIPLAMKRIISNKSKHTE
ncbi:hypothetical protein TBLA_0A05530 [Henningerozyma blattae CBS 6284]|uniref:Uncharacterized protein n=1 Tax=Henningerozyma blattae (strain ATCC 34711 / CBS 6284 / DSM 70876 / NBRC 10599 / NRRL Y-10934 / UCD 77-7) TaxID=1071380 RepID=I2GW44_HENB6|nr:hypothetical protein TBLA_0A05530 [Tetrapisispora blattae CBS 6284]CCH58346.1 hypothetical protein TBLA_0A05530 [Tetrapisispora blattae CBS 6284]